MNIGLLDPLVDISNVAEHMGFGQHYVDKLKSLLDN